MYATYKSLIQCMICIFYTYLLGCLFTLLMIFFKAQKFCIFVKSNFSIFNFIALHTWGDI